MNTIISQGESIVTLFNNNTKTLDPIIVLRFDSNKERGHYDPLNQSINHTSAAFIGVIDQGANTRVA
jgi:hypothetical protein